MNIKLFLFFLICFLLTLIISFVVSANINNKRSIKQNSKIKELKKYKYRYYNIKDN